MPSDFMKILLAIQSDLNAMTLHTISSNRALSALLESYNAGVYSPETNTLRAKAWSDALSCLSDATESFVNDAARLEAYINGQR